MDFFLESVGQADRGSCVQKQPEGHGVVAHARVAHCRGVLQGGRRYNRTIYQYKYIP